MNLHSVCGVHLVLLSLLVQRSSVHYISFLQPSKGQFLFLQLPDCLPANKSAASEATESQHSPPSKTNGASSESKGGREVRCMEFQRSSSVSVCAMLRWFVHYTCMLYHVQCVHVL